MASKKSELVIPISVSDSYSSANPKFMVLKDNFVSQESPSHSSTLSDVSRPAYNNISADSGISTLSEYDHKENDDPVSIDLSGQLAEKKNMTTFVHNLNALKSKTKNLQSTKNLIVKKYQLLKIL